MFDTVRPPPEVLQALREIDPDADLLHVPGGFWLLGVRGPNPSARKALADALKADPHGAHRRRLDKSDRDLEAVSLDAFRSPTEGLRIELLQFYAQGFRPIQLYETHGPIWEIVHDFRKRDHNWRTRPEEAWSEFKDEARVETGDKRRTAVIKEFVQSEMGFMYHHVMRKAKRFWQRVAFPGRAA